MKNTFKVFKAGTRGSRLALIQQRETINLISRLLPQVAFETVVLSTPGDRDRATDLRQSPTDFFTQDLDAAVRDGRLDCATHSAKDLPEPMPDDLDWFWLPWREDPRDVLVLAADRSLVELPVAPVIGISSERRASYARRRFPKADIRPIRGNIEDRLAQLDAGKYDLLIMAGAALLRLDMEDRITEWIELGDLATPEGQGSLALTFRRHDRRFEHIRSLFVPAVTFVGAGVGHAGYCTMAGVNALRRCEGCLFDTLMEGALLDELPAGALQIDVGKRAGHHKMEQEQITALIARYARQGHRVVRLKGGDPGIFGRLAEETEALDALRLPYRMIPGVSSLQMATTGTGMLLTRRDVARGFCVLTPRLQGGGIAPVNRAARGQLPMVFFMGVSVAAETAHALMADGLPPKTPAAMVFDAGGEDELVVRDSLAAFAEPEGPDAQKTKTALAQHRERPGLFLVGEFARHAFVRDSGALEGRKILLTCSEALLTKAADRVYDLGGIPVQRPLIRLVPRPAAMETLAGLPQYDWVVLTSPASARCFASVLRNAGFDLRRMPKIMVSGPGTAAELSAGLGLYADLVPPENFSADALIEAARPVLNHGAKILRLRSDKAGLALSTALEACGGAVTDCVLYSHEPVIYPGKPDFDAVFFASASAVEAFVAQWGAVSLEGTTVVALGAPTAAALSASGIRVDVQSPEATVADALNALAAYWVNARLANDAKEES